MARHRFEAAEWEVLDKNGKVYIYRSHRLLWGR
jgi:hypothetical protein